VDRKEFLLRKFAIGGGRFKINKEKDAAL